MRDRASAYVPTNIWLVGLNQKHKSTFRENVIVLQLLVLINYQKCLSVGFKNFFPTHSWFVRSKALLSAVVGDSLQSWVAVHSNCCIISSLSGKHDGAAGFMTLKGCRNSHLSLCAGSKCCLPVWHSHHCEVHVIICMQPDPHPHPLSFTKAHEAFDKVPFVYLFQFTFVLFFFISLRVFFISSSGEASRCFTRDCARTARSSWRRLQSCTSCTCLHSGVVFMHTPLPVTD